MPNLGAHVSVAGGLHEGVRRALAEGCSHLQVFTKNQNRWEAPPPTDEAVRLLKAEVRACGVRPISSHASYLINAASPDRALRERSIRAMVDEVERCSAYGIPLLVFHPGAHMGEGEAAGVRRTADALRRIVRSTRGARVRVLVECTAGQGTCLGWKIEQLAEMLDRAGEPRRTGVCLDTCHLFAAGYDLRSADGYAATIDAIEERLGLERVALWHVNDSKRELGSRVDRHEHLGRGAMGAAAFARLMADRRFATIPMVLETPKTPPGDAGNLRLLRDLRRKARAKARKRATAS